MTFEKLNETSAQPGSTDGLQGSGPRRLEANRCCAGWRCAGESMGDSGCVFTAACDPPLSPCKGKNLQAINDHKTKCHLQVRHVQGYTVSATGPSQGCQCSGQKNVGCGISEKGGGRASAAPRPVCRDSGRKDRPRLCLRREKSSLSVKQGSSTGRRALAAHSALLRSAPGGLEERAG